MYSKVASNENVWAAWMAWWERSIDHSWSTKVQKEEEATSVNHSIFAVLSWGIDVENVPKYTSVKYSHKTGSRITAGESYLRSWEGKMQYMGNIWLQLEKERIKGDQDSTYRKFIGLWIGNKLSIFISYMRCPALYTAVLYLVYYHRAQCNKNRMKKISYSFL